MHRLNRAEYANAVRDLLGVSVDAATLLPARAADWSATSATSFIVLTRSLDVAVISREVAPISVVVAAVSLAVACWHWLMSAAI